MNIKNLALFSERHKKPFEAIAIRTNKEDEHVAIKDIIG